MRSSSSRLRTGVALASTLIALVFTLGAPALAGERGGKPEDGSNGSGRQTDTNPDDHPSGKDKSEESGGSGSQGNSGSDPDGDSNGGADKPGGDGGYDDDQDGNNGCGNDDDFEDDNNGNCGGPERDRDRCVPASEQGREHGRGRGVKGERCDEAVGNGGTQTPPTTTPTNNTSTNNTSTNDTSTNVVAGTVTNTAAETFSGTASVTETVAPEVLGSAVDRDVPGAVLEAHPPIETKVLGVSIDRPSAGEAAGTGAAVLGTTTTRGALARTGSALMLVALAGLVLVGLGYGLKRFGRRSTI